MSVEPSGHAVRVGENVELNVVRIFPHDQIPTWSFLTESAKLGQWYGTVTGDPATGSVTLAFVEAPDDPEVIRILLCEPPHRLDVALPMGWELSVSLAPHPAGTRVVLTQLLDAASLPQAGDIGAGWEYYLDRWGRSMEGADPDGVDWADYHPGLVEHYTPRG